MKVILTLGALLIAATAALGPAMAWWSSIDGTSNGTFKQERRDT
jgi:hypothetical protein